MGYFIAAVCFWMITAILFLCTIWIYMKLASSVRNKEAFPGWMYKIGHAIRGRGSDPYEDIANAAAWKEATLFLIILVIVNGILFSVKYLEAHNADAALYACLLAEFWIILAVNFLWNIFKIGVLVIHTVRKSPKEIHDYASTNAVVGLAFLTSFLLMLTLTLTGVPAKPVKIQIADSDVTIGKTKASELLKDGFTFSMRSPEEIITNHRDSHFYYGEFADLVRDGKSYGIVSLTPEKSDTAMLKDCVITYYTITAGKGQFDEIKINGKEVSGLKWDEFADRKLIDVFSMTPADYKEMKGDDNYRLQLQTHPYVLWKRYTIEADFHEGEPYKYDVMAQHTIWEE